MLLEFKACFGACSSELTVSIIRIQDKNNKCCKQGKRKKEEEGKKYKDEDRIGRIRTGRHHERRGEEVKNGGA